MIGRMIVYGLIGALAGSKLAKRPGAGMLAGLAVAWSASSLRGTDEMHGLTTIFVKYVRTANDARKVVRDAYFRAGQESGKEYYTLLSRNAKDNTSGWTARRILDWGFSNLNDAPKARSDLAGVIHEYLAWLAKQKQKPKTVVKAKETTEEDDEDEKNDKKKTKKEKRKARRRKMKKALRTGVKVGSTLYKAWRSTQVTAEDTSEGPSSAPVPESAPGLPMPLMIGIGAVGLLVIVGVIATSKGRDTSHRKGE